MALRYEVDFHRPQDLIGHIRMLAVQRLAAYDDELLLAGDPAGGSQDVINLLLLHLAGSPLRAAACRRKAAIDATGWSARHAPGALRIIHRRLPVRAISAILSTRRSRLPVLSTD